VGNAPVNILLFGPCGSGKSSFIQNVMTLLSPGHEVRSVVTHTQR
jgi:predicted GTPase